MPSRSQTEDLWLVDLDRDTNPQRLTFSPSLESWPAWLTDDRFAYGAGGGERSIFEQTVGGERRLWLQGGGSSGVTTGDNGEVAVFVGITNPSTRADLWVWTGKGPPGGVPLIAREGDQAQAQLSPDARWLAYVSNETGRNEVFVAAFRYDAASGHASVGESVPISNGGDFAPRWRGDGKELFYLKIDGSVMAVPRHQPPAAQVDFRRARGNRRRRSEAGDASIDHGHADPAHGVLRDPVRWRCAAPASPFAAAAVQARTEQERLHPMCAASCTP